ncbi:MAG: GtrA family protein [Pseudomonadota bacterium]
MARRTIAGRGWRFVATGVIVNAALFLLLWLLLRSGMDYLIAVTIVYIVGIVWGYLQNRIWSWQSTAPAGRSFWNYLVVYAGIYVAHIGFVTGLVEWLEMAPFFAVMVSVLLLITPVFVALDRLVFREQMQ